MSKPDKLKNLTKKDLLERLSISKDTLRMWENRFDVSFELDAEGRKVYPPDSVRLLEQVRQLREEEKSFEELRITNRMLRDRLEEKRSLETLEQEVKKTALKIRVFSVILIVVGVLGLGYELAEIGYIGQDTLFWGGGSVALGLIVRFS